MDCRQMIIEERLSIFLILLKISPNLSGYDFFKSGAKKIIDDGSKKFNVGSGLYLEIANERGVKKDLVDRAMRHAIDVSVKRNGLCDFEKCMNVSFSGIKPTPRELLCMLAEMAVMQCNKILNNHSYATVAL